MGNPWEDRSPETRRDIVGHDATASIVALGTHDGKGLVYKGAAHRRAWTQCCARIRDRLCQSLEPIAHPLLRHFRLHLDLIRIRRQGHISGRRHGAICNSIATVIGIPC
jgi:hypothetical protein